MTRAGLCQAVVSEPPHYFESHYCGNKAKETVGGVAVCGVHARVARGWGDSMQTMIDHWWKPGPRTFGRGVS
jgi:hypothetical protein